MKTRILPALVSATILSLLCVNVLGKDFFENTDWLDRLWVSFEESVFIDDAELIDQDIPQETKSYSKEFSLLSPKFALGYRFTPRWSVELNWQFGPKESFMATNRDDEVFQYASVESRFLSVLVSRDFSLSQNLTLETKAGLTNSFFENRVGTERTTSVRWTTEETRPVATLGFRREITPKLSAMAGISSYFLDQSEPMSTTTFGLRYSF